MLAVLLAMPSVVLSAYLIWCVAHGSIRISGRRYTRARSPKRFWATVAFGIVCAVALLMPVWVALQALFPVQIPALYQRHMPG